MSKNVKTVNVMTLDEFEALAEIHGGDLDRWPAERRAEAERLVESDARARLALEQAAEIDRLLGSDAAVEAPSALMARVLGDAAEIAAARRSSPTARRGAAEAPGWRVWAEQLLFGSGGLAAAGFGAAAMAGLVAGVLAPSAAAENAPGGYVSVADLVDQAVGDLDGENADQLSDDPDAVL